MLRFIFDDLLKTCLFYSNLLHFSNDLLCVFLYQLFVKSKTMLTPQTNGNKPPNTQTMNGRHHRQVIREELL